MSSNVGLNRRRLQVTAVGVLFLCGGSAVKLNVKYII